MDATLQQILHTAILQLGAVGGPMLAALLAAGLIIGVLQAATQINDPAVGFVPRIGVVLLLVWVLGGWMMQRLAQYFTASVSSLAGR